MMMMMMMMMMMSAEPELAMQRTDQDGETPSSLLFSLVYRALLVCLLIGPLLLYIAASNLWGS